MKQLSSPKKQIRRRVVVDGHTMLSAQYISHSSNYWSAFQRIEIWDLQWFWSLQCYHIDTLTFFARRPRNQYNTWISNDKFIDESFDVNPLTNKIGQNEEETFVQEPLFRELELPIYVQKNTRRVYFKSCDEKNVAEWGRRFCVGKPQGLVQKEVEALLIYFWRTEKGKMRKKLFWCW